jgi:hypothetical protein
MYASDCFTVLRQNVDCQMSNRQNVELQIVGIRLKAYLIAYLTWQNQLKLGNLILMFNHLAGWGQTRSTLSLLIWQFIVMFYNIKITCVPCWLFVVLDDVVHDAGNGHHDGLHEQEVHVESVVAVFLRESEMLFNRSYILFILIHRCNSDFLCLENFSYLSRTAVMMFYGN